jgi:hypothetical protein
MEADEARGPRYQTAHCPTHSSNDGAFLHPAQYQLMEWRHSHAQTTSTAPAVRIRLEATNPTVWQMQGCQPLSLP